MSDMKKIHAWHFLCISFAYLYLVLSFSYCGRLLLLFQIEVDAGTVSEEREMRLFPDKEQEDQKITCHDMTQDFLIYGTDVISSKLHCNSEWYSFSNNF